MTLGREFDVVDAHQHYETGFGLASTLTGAPAGGEANSEAQARVELATRLRILDSEHVSGAVILPGHTYLRPRGLRDTAEVNNAVAAYCGRAPDRLLAAVGVAEPLYGPAAYSEVRRCRDELGMRGISFHNAFQGVPIDSPLMRPLLENIGAAGLVPFIHVMGSPFETIWQLDVLAQDFPDLPIIVLDAFYDLNSVHHVRRVAERRPNLTFDLALLVSFEVQALPVVRALGAARFVYGTDQYSAPLMTAPFGSCLSGIRSANLSDGDKAAILGGNIRRILAI